MLPTKCLRNRGLQQEVVQLVNSNLHCHVRVCEDVGVGVLAHHSRGLHGVADDHDDAAFVVVEDSRRGALQELAVRAER